MLCSYEAGQSKILLARNSGMIKARQKYSIQIKKHHIPKQAINFLTACFDYN